MGLIKTSQPALHADQHLPDGSDPIPGLLVTSTGGDWATSILSLSDLLGYWRLGEGSSPYADTSGHPDGPQDMLRSAFGIAMTQDVTPGLLPEDQDDGAVAFNNEGADGDSTLSDFLQTDVSRFGFDPTDPYTVIARIKPAASAASFYGHIAGTMAQVVGSPNWAGGWSLRVRWPSMLISFARGSSSSVFNAAESATGISADTEYTVAGTYDGTTIRVYINGTLAGSQADTHNIPATPEMRIGGTESGSGDWQPFYGTVDEVAVYGQALTASQIAALHNEAVTDPAGGGIAPSGSAGGALDGSYPNPGLAATVAGAGLTETSDVLSVNVDGTTLEIASDTVRVKTGGIGATQLASTAVTPGSYGDATHIAAFTVDADGRLTAASNVTFTGGPSPTDTAGWMPLTTVLGGTPDLVWDSTDSLIPTYGPF